jgi:glycosyltransferase involved in cell wall biosynthesis
MSTLNAGSFMRLLLLNRYFWPDISATSQLASDLAFELAGRGVEVTAICSRQLYVDAAAHLPANEMHRGVQIVRIAATRFGRFRLAGRALDYASYYAAATWVLWRRARRGNVVIAMTDPPLLGVAAATICRLRGAVLVQWLQDAFPEVALRVGVLPDGILAHLLQRLRNRSLRRSQAVVVVGERVATRLAPHCARPPVLIPNWALEEDGESHSPLRSEWGLDRHFVVGYSGNMGRAHRLRGLIDAAALLRDLPGVRFVLIGGGAQRTALEQHASATGVTNVEFRPYQPREKLRDTLCVPDLHVVSLDESLEGLILPSKFVGAIALSRPVLWIGDPNGEIGTLIRSSGCGVTVPSGEPVVLAALLRELALDHAAGGGRLATMAAAARSLWQARFRRQAALQAWMVLLSGYGDVVRRV